MLKREEASEKKAAALDQKEKSCRTVLQRLISGKQRLRSCTIRRLQSLSVYPVSREIRRKQSS